MKQITRFIRGLSAAALLFTASRIYAQQGFEFVMQDISDLVYAVSIGRETPIVCDDTVSGRASFRFSGSNFDDAFDAFLSTNRLYVHKTLSVWTVSRIRILHNDAGLIQLDAYDVSPSVLFEKLSLFSPVTVLYDPLPVQPISVHISNVDTFAAVSLIMRQIAGYTVADETSFVSVRKTPALDRSAVKTGKIDVLIEENGTAYTIKADNARFSDAAELLFEKAHKEYVLFASGDTVLRRLSFESKPFDVLLSLVCESAGCSYEVKDGVYYIVGGYDGTNAVKDSRKKWVTVNVSSVKISDFISKASARFGPVPSVAVNQTTLMCQISSEAENDFLQFVRMCDTAETVKYAELQYIKTEDLRKNLPPGIDASHIRDTGSGNSFFYAGSDVSFRSLKEHLKVIDVMRPLIKYDVLVIQFEENDDFSWTAGVSASPVELGDTSQASVQVSPDLSLQFDVAARFGVFFAAKLQTAVSSNKARVFADTTLCALSGSPVKFKNTHTYRYRDSNIDPETGKAMYTGVTREVAAGLVIELEGSVSGANVITTAVSASVSRHSVDVLQTAGSPPPTTEKIITTQVRSRSGEPVILSGLIQDASTSSQKGVPLLSRIPLIGWLFKAAAKTSERTEVVIYLVPYAADDTSGLTDDAAGAAAGFEGGTDGNASVYENDTIRRLFKKYAEPFID